MVEEQLLLLPDRQSHLRVAGSEHNLSARVALSGPRDELRQLADTFDAMLGRLEAVDLATIVEDVLDIAAPGDSRIHSDLRPAPTHGDAILLERLVTNLVDNGLRHNVPDGDIWLSTSTVDGQAVLTVANTGPVVLPDAVDGLFEPFRRLRERTGEGGVGLGLAIVASITTIHGGQVHACPEEAGGLRVTVTLPGCGPVLCPSGPGVKACAAANEAGPTWEAE